MFIGITSLESCEIRVFLHQVELHTTLHLTSGVEVFMRLLADYSAIWLIPAAESLIGHIFAPVIELS
jgi:hypothetical protein